MKQQPTIHLNRIRPAFLYLLLVVALIFVAIVCVCMGSVNISFADTLGAVFQLPMCDPIANAIILPVRLPRVLCVMLVGAALSLCGCAMQGLLRNPLADGSTLGVSSGASLGAVLSIAFGITIPGIPLAGSVVMAMLFAFVSTVVILSLAYKLDCSLSTNTIILIGVIFSMFINSIMSLIITFAADKVKNITFWTMGSLSGGKYTHAILLFSAIVIFGGIILHYANELNAFALSEESARNIGVDVKRSKLAIMISVSGLIGVCVAIGGTIAFVGLVIPHMTRMLFGANHLKLLPASMLCGAIFLMLCDLASRTLFSPLELPIGVITSLIGSITFVIIFCRARTKAGKPHA